MRDDYKDSHVFPSGVTIDYESFTDEEYFHEMQAISSQQELVKFVERWRYLCPEIVAENLSFERLNSLRGNLRLQDEYAKAQDDPSCAAHINLLIPPTILFCMMKSRKYGVPFGAVVLQLWNAECFVQSPDGAWNLPLKPPSTT